MERIAVEYADVSADGAARVRMFEVEGESSEAFEPLARREIGDVPDGNVLRLAVSGPFGSATATFSPRLTMAEVARFAEGERVPLTSGGIGGQWIVDVWTLTANGLTLVALYEACKWGVRKVEGLRFARHRKAAQEWAMSGVRSAPDAELTRLVKAERHWPHHVIEDRFGLDRQEAVALFGHLGYEYESEWAMWSERAEE